MSDNGVYVLVTDGPEYRVAYSENIERIYGNLHESYESNDFRPNYWTPNMGAIIEIFGGCVPFTTTEDALQLAYIISHDHNDYLEDGICFINDFSELKFPTSTELPNGE